MITDHDVGLAVRSARLAAGYTAAELATQCDMLPSTMSKVEHGDRSLSFTEALQLCTVLRIEIDDLARLAAVVQPGVSNAKEEKQRLKEELRQLEQKAFEAAIALTSKAHRR